MSIDERVVVETWERQGFPAEALASLGLAVVFRGLPSDAGGPDYQDAILSDHRSRLLRGDIEFHVRSSDWYRHGHHRDAAYNQVILHVVWDDDATRTTSQANHEVPTLALGNGSQAHFQLDTLPLLTHPCVASFARLDSSTLEPRLANLGCGRFEQLSDHFAAELESDDADQVIYRSMLEALGYASNRSAFRELAAAVPYGWIMSLPATERAATLLEAAGLGPRAMERPPAHLPPGSWRLARLRPANHPSRRILGLATLLERSRPSLSSSLTEVILAAKHPGDLRSQLMVGGSVGGLIGAGRADEMAASVILPFVAAYERRSAALDLFLRYPSPPANRWTRAMLDLLDEAGQRLKVRSAPIHQGLHALYHQFCRQERFEVCPICQM